MIEKPTNRIRRTAELVNLTQTLRWLSGGRLEFTMILGALGEAERWVMGWGPAAEVIAPKELCESVRYASSPP